MTSFTERDLRNDIIRIWGENGAHLEMFDHLVQRMGAAMTTSGLVNELYRTCEQLTAERNAFAAELEDVHWTAVDLETTTADQSDTITALRLELEELQLLPADINLLLQSLADAEEGVVPEDIQDLARHILQTIERVPKGDD